METQTQELIADAAENGMKSIHKLIGVVMQILTEIEQLNFKPAIIFPPSECLSPTTAETFSMPQEEICVQDSFTRISTCRDRYDELKSVIANSLTAIQDNRNISKASKELIDSHEVQQLISQRDQLRLDIYNKNLVVKDLIDRIRELQLNINLTQGKPDKARRPIN